MDDKDGCLFPTAIPNPSGKPELAILHRPLFPGTRPEETERGPASRDLDIGRESICISYRPISMGASQQGLRKQFSHQRLATPVSPWERLKIGCGTPPILTRHGWLIVYHGVSEIEALRTDSSKDSNRDGRQLCYSAGVMVLSKGHPQVSPYRSAEPVLTPTLAEECHGTVAHVVFPTGVDRPETSS